MELCRLISLSGCVFVILFCSITAHAGAPLWRFSTDSDYPPQLKVISTGTATVKYMVSNNSNRSRQLVIQPTAGVRQVGTCQVGPKNGGDSNCTLTLTIDGSELTLDGLSEGPALCQSNTDGTANPSLCYQPSKGDTLSVTLLKAPIKGLVNMGNISFYNKPSLSPVNDPSDIANYASSFAAMVINVTWDQLQPNDRDTLVENNAIDQALTAIEAYNQSHSQYPIVAKLRVWGGFTAPDWAKAINGGPIPIDVQTSKPQSGTIGLFWTSGYISAWRNLQSLLAARYNANPLIAQVSVTSCASNTDEPFVSWLDSPTISQLQSFGFTDQQQKACLSGAIDDYSAWTNTMVDFPFSLFHTTDGGTVSPDSDFTVQVMNQCQESERCILSNHALNLPLPTPDTFIFTKMDTLYNNQPNTTYIDFQTASPKLVDWCGAINQGITYHANSIELWPDNGGFTGFTPNVVSNLANALKNKTAPDQNLCP